MRTRTVIEMSYSELETLVHKHMIKHRDYSFVDTEECGNDTSHTFDVNGEIDEWERKELAKGKGSNYAVLNHLCAAGVIPPGSYLIEVCW